MARKEQPRTPADFQPAPPRAKCEKCVNDAEMSKIIDGRRTNLCFGCDKRMVTEEAERNCAAKGLRTPAECRAWLATHKLLVKHAPMREPGED